jgi:hypothetical protein
MKRIAKNVMKIFISVESLTEIHTLILAVIKLTVEDVQRCRSSKLFGIGAPAVEFAIVFAPQITHVRGPIEDGLIIHFHSRRPARDHKLFFVGSVIFAGVAHGGQFLRERGRFIARVRVKEIFELELAIVGDFEIAQLSHGLRGHLEL